MTGAEPAAVAPGDAAQADAEAPLTAEPEEQAVDRAGAADEGSEGASAEASDAPGVSALQASALEACQEAQAALERGEPDVAVERADHAYSLMLQLPEEDGADSAQAKQDIRLLVAQIIARAYASEAPRAEPATRAWDLGLPMVDNEHVQREIASFTGKERDAFLDAYRRSGRYRPMIVEKLERAGLPTQLSWLPLVESNFEVNALSRAGALGLWQFISSTGLRYGLARDAWHDKRLDPHASTDAAIAYLADLHRIFGDWPKALAAYNCGESLVQRLQGHTAEQYMDFWDLFALLPGETRRYVPRLIAVLQLVENPATYGLALPEVDAPMVAAEVVTTERAVKLDALDVALGLAEGTLAALNPALRHAATPANKYDLRVPVGSAEATRAAIGALAEFALPKPTYVVHRVRVGETLSLIAARYRTSVATILRYNRLRSAHRIWPGQRLRIPLRT